MKTPELVPIREHVRDNQQFVDNPLCRDALYATIDFYKRVGYVPPWIGYFVRQGGKFVGAAGFKGQPKNGVVEVAYGTFDQYQNRGIGTAICKALVNLSRETDPTIRITARTFSKNNYSTKILERNSFELLGEVNDPDDGDVWEWELMPDK